MCINYIMKNKILILILFALSNALITKAEKSTLSLYERIGGQPAIDATVELFYKKVLSDSRVCHFFKGINMNKKNKQRLFVAAALGGPEAWSGKNMRPAHDSLDLNNTHFNAIADNLEESLKEMKVPQVLIKEVMNIVESTRNDVLNL